MEKTILASEVLTNPEYKKILKQIQKANVDLNELVWVRYSYVDACVERWEVTQAYPYKVEITDTDGIELQYAKHGTEEIIKWVKLDKVKERTFKTKEEVENKYVTGIVGGYPFG